MYAYDRVARQFFIVAFLLLYAGNVCAAVVFVDHEAGGDGLGGDWENSCTTIASGLSAASATDEVWVADGTYPESVTLVSDVKLYGGFDATEASLEDRSDSAAASIIDANGSGSAVTLDTISDALIDGFTITGGNASVGGGIYASNADDTNTISNCIITWNTATSGGGIDLAFGSSPYITDCIISNNTAENGGGIYFSTSSSVITNCTIIANTAEDGDGNSGGGGLHLFASSPTLAGCTIVGNYADAGLGGGGVFMQNQSQPAFTNCTISGNKAFYDGGGFFLLSVPIDINKLYYQRERVR